MRRILLILLLLLAAGSTACSFSIEFVVVNESNSPIEAWLEIDSPQTILILLLRLGRYP